MLVKVRRCGTTHSEVNIIAVAPGSGECIRIDSGVQPQLQLSSSVKANYSHVTAFWLSTVDRHTENSDFNPSLRYTARIRLGTRVSASTLSISFPIGIISLPALSALS